MSDLYLLDSSFWILSHRRDAPESVARRASELLRQGRPRGFQSHRESTTQSGSWRVAVNEVVRLEVLMGYRSEEEAAAVSHDMDALEFLPLDRQVWDDAWRLGIGLRRSGLPKGFPDLLIAATAIRHDAVLVHADSDFETIAQHSRLRTESHLDALEA